MEIISRKTRTEFREMFVAHYTLATIADEFDAADLMRSESYAPDVGGQRRQLVEQYYFLVDWTDPADVAKVLQVFEHVLINLQDLDLEADFRRLLLWLERDGYDFDRGRLTRVGGLHGASHLTAVARGAEAEYLRVQTLRMEGSVDVDPALAIGTAKEMIETCCKTILDRAGATPPENQDLPKLVKATTKLLALVPEGIPDQAKGADVIRRTLSNLASVAHGLAELRNLYGSGHGKEGKWRGLAPRHARLATTSAVALVTFLFETADERGL